MLDFKVIDLSSRLPGPYAGYLLSSMGAKVIKIENIRHIDAFSDQNLHKLDPIFKLWYQNLNENKEKIFLDYDLKSDLESLHQLIKEADIILVPNKQKVIDLISLDEISKSHPLAIIKIGGSFENNKPMHDLNALAQMDAFHMHAAHSNKPPFLPIAGISFGQQIATQAIASYIKVLKEKKSHICECYLDLETKRAFSPFWDESLTECDKHLHNGRFPCYNLYRTQDGGTLVVAAVEEKFWKIFTKSFELPLTLDDRYDTSQRVYNIIAEKIANLTIEEAKILLKQDCCVSFTR